MRIFLSYVLDFDESVTTILPTLWRRQCYQTTFYSFFQFFAKLYQETLALMPAAPLPVLSESPQTPRLTGPMIRLETSTP